MSYIQQIYVISGITLDEGAMHRVPTKTRGGARLYIGFLLARNFTLSAFANFIDVIRPAADQGDSSRPLL
jgi:hypothetical protein